MSLYFFVTDVLDTYTRVPLYPARQRIERASRKLASLKQVREPYPFNTPMLGAGQWVCNGVAPCLNPAFGIRS